MRTNFPGVGDFELVSRAECEQTDGAGKIKIIVKTKVIATQADLQDVATEAHLKSQKEVRLQVRFEETKEEPAKKEIKKPEMIDKNTDPGEITARTEEILTYAEAIKDQCQPGTKVMKTMKYGEHEVTGFLYDGKLIGWATYVIQDWQMRSIWYNDVEVGRCMTPSFKMCNANLFYV